MSERGISLGDHVRIVTTLETRTVGYADLEGMCLGFTTPSVTGVEVVGDQNSDLAYAIKLATGEVVWFTPDSVQDVDVAPGLEARIGDKRFVRGEDGEWHPKGPQ